MGIFITGTDTDVGKTLVAAWICLHTRRGYWKPVQTGAGLGTDTDFMENLGISPCYPACYRFQAPESPHTAAKQEGAEIEMEVLCNPPVPSMENLVVEGAGGVLVPLAKDVLMMDLIQRLGLPVVVVARSGLGTLNHTLLTLEALRHRKIEPLGVVLNGPPHPENKQSLLDYGKTRILAEIPRLPAVTRDTLLSIPPSEDVLSLVSC